MSEIHDSDDDYSNNQALVHHFMDQASSSDSSDNESDVSSTSNGKYFNPDSKSNQGLQDKAASTTASSKSNQGLQDKAASTTASSKSNQGRQDKAASTTASNTGKRKSTSFTKAQTAKRQAAQNVMSQSSPKFPFYKATDSFIINTDCTLLPLDTKKNSVVWNYFKKFESKSLSCFVACVACYDKARTTNVDVLDNTKKINFTVRHEKGNTSLLTHHLERFHPDLFSETTILNEGQGGTITKFLTKSKFTESFFHHLLQWVINCNIPYSMVSDENFRKMISVVNPSVPVFSRQTVSKKKEMYNEKKQIIKSMLSDKLVAITTDGWTSQHQHLHYIAVTAHFIQQWKLKSVVLACRNHSESCTSVNLKKLLLQVMEEFAIPKTSVVSVVSDTANNMNCFGRLIEVQEKIPWIGCIDHRLQLITKIAIDDLEGTTGTMKKARELVRSFSHSDQATAALRRYQEEARPTSRSLVLIQDITTRWWSTYSMAERLLKLKVYVELCIDNHFVHESHLLTNVQWAVLEKIMQVLEPFKFFQQLLEGENYVTLSIVPVALKMLKDGLQRFLEDENALSVHVLCQKMLDKFGEEFDVFTLNDEAETFFDAYLIRNDDRRIGISREIQIAAYLDPRTKNLAGIPDDDYTREDIWEEVAKRCLKIRDSVRPRPLHNLVPNVTVNLPNYPAFLLDIQNTLGQQAVVEQPTIDPVTKAKADIEDEMKRYKEEPLLNLVNLIQNEEGTGEPKYEFNDPLIWWELKSDFYPYLSTLVLRILCIPATSAPSERLFSAAGITIAADRSNMLPHHCESLVFLRKNWEYLKEA